MIEILILYILLKYDATIYKIKKLIGEKFFILSSPSLGAINPALKKLESLSCVEFQLKITDGGMPSKTYKITPFGQKYLKSAVTSFEFKNKSSVLNNVSALICVSDILEDDEKAQVMKNCTNKLIILKADINEALQNPYNMYTEAQINVMEANLSFIDRLLEDIK